MAKQKPIPIGMYFIFVAFSLNLMSVAALLPMANATPENPTCVELGTCMFANDPLNVMLKPFDTIFGGLSLIIFWSLVIGILWLRTENPMLVGILGVTMIASYSYAVDPTLQSPEFETARTVGSVLLLASLGISVYQLFHRLYAPPQ